MAPGAGCVSPDDPYPDDVWLFKQDAWGMGPPPGSWHTCGPYRITPAADRLIIWYKFGGCDVASAGYGDGVSVVAVPDSTATQFCKTFANDEIGPHTLALCVTDNDGLTSCCSTTLQVIGPQPICLTLPADCWHRITLPCPATDLDPWEVFDELRSPNQPVDLLSGCLCRYDGDLGSWTVYYHFAPTEFGPITPGDGYLLYLFEDATICYQAECSPEPRQVHLPDVGWHLIGSPRPTDTHLQDTAWYHGATGPWPLSAAGNLWVQDPLVGYSCDLMRYYSAGLLPTDEDHYLRAFQAYWLYSFVDDVTMEVPPP
jgi:hypothetical protein